MVMVIRAGAALPITGQTHCPQKGLEASGADSFLPVVVTLRRTHLPLKQIVNLNSVSFFLKLLRHSVLGLRMKLRTQIISFCLKFRINTRV